MQRTVSFLYAALAIAGSVFPQGALAGYGRYIRIYESEAVQTGNLNLQQVKPYGE